MYRVEFPPPGGCLRLTRHLSDEERGRRLGLVFLRGIRPLVPHVGLQPSRNAPRVAGAQLVHEVRGHLEGFAGNTRRLSTVEPDTKGLPIHSQLTRCFVVRARTVLRRASEASPILAEDRLFESSMDPISHPFSMRLLVQSGRMFLSQNRGTTRPGGPLDILLFGDCGCVDQPTYESCASRSNRSGDQCRFAFYLSCISYSPCLSL